MRPNGPQTGLLQPVNGGASGRPKTSDSAKFGQLGMEDGHESRCGTSLSQTGEQQATHRQKGQGILRWLEKNWEGADQLGGLKSTCGMIRG